MSKWLLFGLYLLVVGVCMLLLLPERIGWILGIIGFITAVPLYARLNKMNP